MSDLSFNIILSANSDRSHHHWLTYSQPHLFQKADLAIADPYITYEREKAVEFFNPFINWLNSILLGTATDSSKKMSACMLVLVLLATSYTSLHTRQRYASCKNFPVVGIKISMK